MNPAALTVHYCGNETRAYCDGAKHSSLLSHTLSPSLVGHHVGQKWPESWAWAQEAAPRPNKGGEEEEGGGEEEERGKEKSEYVRNHRHTYCNTF